jgi:hypothetical protein
LSAEADSIGMIRHFPHERGEALSAEADNIGMNRHFPHEQGEALSAVADRIFDTVCTLIFGCGWMKKKDESPGVKR